MDSSSVCVEDYSKGTADVKGPSFFNPETHLEDLQDKSPRGIGENEHTEENTEISLLPSHKNRGISNLWSPMAGQTSSRSAFKAKSPLLKCERVQRRNRSPK